MKLTAVSLLAVILIPIGDAAKSIILHREISIVPLIFIDIYGIKGLLN